MMGLPYAESADDDVMYSQERDLEGGVHVAICHPADQRKNGLRK